VTVRGHTLTVRAYGATHTGRVRTSNEDSYLVGDAVFAVADGMGGHQAGEIASDAALEPLRALDIPSMTEPAAVGDALATAVQQANTLVVERAQGDPSLEGMGTTLTAIAIREGRLHLAHVGDSRAYLLRENEKISQLTTDHTLVERLIQEGRLSRDEAATHPQRNVITRAIGHEATVEVEVLPPIMLQDGDQILLCSDGLSGPVDDERISSILAGTTDGEAAVNALLAEANAAGGPDNITAVLLRIGDRSQDAQTVSVEKGASSTQQITLLGKPDPNGTAQISDDADTAEVEEESWAETIERLGTPADTSTQARPRGRLAATVLALLMVVAVVVVGGWLVMSRSYYVSSHEGMLAIYQGAPQEIAGLSVARVLPEEITTTPVTEFPDFRRRAIENGFSAQSLADARRIVEDLQAQLRQNQIENQTPSRSVGEPQTGPSQGP
jgi:serine/threonine protein phosphatase PrpC